MIRRIISRIISVIMGIVLIVGVSCLLYAPIKDWWDRLQQDKEISTYEVAVAQTDDTKIKEMWDKAVAYNEKLKDKPVSYTLSDEETAEYNSLLDVSGTGIMGYVEVKKQNIRLPIYHGTSEGVLQIAVGHLTGSSLPTGGAGTHSVLTGHTGLISAKLFTDIDQMEEGDTFTVTVLDHVLTYQVDQIKVVLPSELYALRIEDGQDYTTLVTCTPYGVNSHRLLVRGHRIATPESADKAKSVIDAKKDAIIINLQLAVPFIAGGAVIALIIVILVRKRKRNKKTD
jgi:sortase A